ncbi:MAG TPA: hypothetical protein VK574_05370 [Terracidiphilus sp.]|nr:hypothetical protein [Terracidiphilus sp.]
MKDLTIFLLAFGLVSCAAGQALPDSPAPAPLPDPAWDRLQSLLNGQPIVVDNTNGPAVHCLFAGVTEAYLFCSPPGNPVGVGFRFNHADVLGVDLDLPHPTLNQARRPERNYHPAWISSMIAGGIVVGLIASQNTDAGKATQDGFIGAAIVGLIGAPLAFIPRRQFAPSGPAYPQYGIGLRFNGSARARPHLLHFPGISR